MKSDDPVVDQKAIDPEQARGKAQILGERERLQTAGITFVAVHYDGSGDEGITEDVKCFRTEEYEHWCGKPDDYDVSHLQLHFEAFVPMGYQDNCGGFGDIIFNVQLGTIRVIHNSRFEDYSTEEYEV